MKQKFEKMKEEAKKKVQDEDFEEELNLFENCFGDTDSDDSDDSSNEETSANLLPPIVLKIER